MKYHAIKATILKDFQYVFKIYMIFVIWAFNAACVTEKQQISISYGLTRLEPMIYRTLDKHANHYTKNIKGDYSG